MANQVKERISDDLNKAMSEGSLRSERIREIVRAAVSQTIDELKAGSAEIRVIAKDAIASVMDTLSEKSQDNKEYVAASIEGTIAGIEDAKRGIINTAQETVDQLQSEIINEEAQLESDVNEALVAIETSDEQDKPGFQVLIQDAIRMIRDRKEFAYLEQQYVNLKAQFERLDAKLADRYGDNYDQVKQRLETAKTWYDAEKERLELGGTDRVQRTQTALEQSLSGAGVSIAHQEQRIKERLRRFLQMALDKLQ